MAGVAASATPARPPAAPTGQPATQARRPRDQQMRSAAHLNSTMARESRGASWSTTPCSTSFATSIFVFFSSDAGQGAGEGEVDGNGGRRGDGALVWWGREAGAGGGASAAAAPAAGRAGREAQGRGRHRPQQACGAAHPRAAPPVHRNSRRRKAHPWSRRHRQPQPGSAACAQSRMPSCLQKKEPWAGYKTWRGAGAQRQRRHALQCTQQAGTHACLLPKVAANRACRLFQLPKSGSQADNCPQRRTRVQPHSQVEFG